MRYIIGGILVALLGGCDQQPKYTVTVAPAATLLRVNQNTGEVCAFRHYQNMEGFPPKLTSEGLTLVGCANGGKQ